MIRAETIREVASITDSVSNGQMIAVTYFNVASKPINPARSVRTQGNGQKRMNIKIRDKYGTSYME
jgi:hypothetical protein